MTSTSREHLYAFAKMLGEEMYDFPIGMSTLCTRSDKYMIRISTDWDYFVLTTLGKYFDLYKHHP